LGFDRNLMSTLRLVYLS